MRIRLVYDMEAHDTRYEAKGSGAKAEECKA